MKKYEVLLRADVYGRVTVQADTEEQAKYIALRSAVVRWEDKGKPEVIIVAPKRD